MRLIVIGGDGHGKSSLIEAIEKVSGIELVEINSGSLKQVNEGISEKMKEDMIIEFDKVFGYEEELLEPNKLKKKGKKIKDWERNKFYQR